MIHVAALLIVGCAPVEEARRPAEPPSAEPTSTEATDTATISPPSSWPTPPDPPEPVPLELCINELMPDNVVSVVDDFGGHADWIELHNPNGWDLPLGGWTITDDPDEPDKHALSADLVLPAGGFLVLWADGFAEVGPTHLSFSLANEGETIGVFAPDGSGSLVTYGDTPADLAVMRLDDCCDEPGCFGFSFGGTPGASNVE